MLKWLAKLIAGKQTANAPRSEADATRYLNTLRERELSVGAALRRGETVARPPGQTGTGLTPAAALPARPAPTRVGGREEIAVQTGVPSGDFGTSMVIGMATGSATLGYLAGGSVAGGLIGEAFSEPDSASSPSFNFGE